MSFIPKTVKIFYSFSPADRSLRQNLDDALFNLKHKHKIITLPEDELELAGLNAKEQINNDLKESDIILLLISQDFFANNEFYEDVIRIAAERYTANEAKVVPVLLRSCDWEPM